MRNIALVLGVVAFFGGFFGCINDPTLDQTTMSDVDSSTETVVDSATQTAE